MIANAVKGAIGGVASAEARRKTLPVGKRPVGNARWRDNWRGGAKGSAGAMGPESVNMTDSFVRLKDAEADALQRQNRALEDQQDYLARRDELLKEREARRRIRPDQ